MCYLGSSIQSLKNAFYEHHLQLDVKSDYVVVESSHQSTNEKIKAIIESAGFCPLISTRKLNGNFVFTLAPYKIPIFFECEPNEKISSQTHILETNLSLVQTKSNYFSVEEISNLLKHALVSVNTVESVLKDKWEAINGFRSHVSLALNEGLSNIIAANYKEEHAIVEIGSGIGYLLPENIRSQTIRIQPSSTEAQLLKKTISEPVYGMSIENLYDCVVDAGKKIPLFFGLNVLDVMSREQRIANLHLICELQNRGDRILLMHDANPAVDLIMDQVESMNSDHIAFPFYTSTKDRSSSLSLILVPKEFIEGIPSQNQRIETIQSESLANGNGKMTTLQYKLHQLQEKYNLKVVALEDFYLTQIKEDLKEAGYQSKSYYHVSFTTGEVSKKLSQVNQDVIFKSTTDIATIRQWALADENFLSMLSKKGLKIPDQFHDAEFLAKLKEKGHKIHGAEILVIEAIKN